MRCFGSRGERWRTRRSPEGGRNLNKLIILSLEPHQERVVDAALEKLALNGVRVMVGHGVSHKDSGVLPHVRHICRPCGWSTVTAIATATRCPRCGKAVETVPDGVTTPIMPYIPGFIAAA